MNLSCLTYPFCEQMMMIDSKWHVSDAGKGQLLAMPCLYKVPCPLLGKTRETGIVCSVPRHASLASHLVDLVIPMQAPDSLTLHAEAILFNSDEHLAQLLDACCPLAFSLYKIVIHERNNLVSCNFVPCLQCPAASTFTAAVYCCTLLYGLCIAIAANP